MFIRLTKLVVIAAGCGLLSVVAVGCNEQVTMDDVNEARENVERERQEDDDARRDVGQTILDEQQETDEVRQKVMKPTLDDDQLDQIREENRETRNAIEDGENRLREEALETREAESELQETKEKFQATQVRDAFVNSIETKLEDADVRIDQLQERAAELEGDAEILLSDQIKVIEKKREQTADALAEVASAELLIWDVHRGEVERNMKDLKALLEAAK